MSTYIPPQSEQQFPQQSQYGQPQSGQQPLPQYEQPYQTRYGWQPVMNYPSPQQFEQIAGQQTKKESLLLPRSAREREGRDDQQGWLAKTTTQADLVCAGWTNSRECEQRLERKPRCGNSRRLFAAP